MGINRLPDANFTPTRNPYNPTGSFKFWCQKVLPTVYDDSLSYYEVLCKVVNYLNDVIQNVDNMNEDITAMFTAYSELQSYVNNYFSSLDVQDEINRKLDSMATDGSLSDIVRPFIPSIVTDWLDANISPTSPAIDKSLSIADAGADAKATGDRFREDERSIDRAIVYSGSGRVPFNTNYINGDIEFRNLTFSYPDSNEEVLKDISFKIKQGENIGVIGKTGCGKTTLVDLLLRLYNVNDNSIFIDGIDINKIPIKTIRKYSSYVPQDNFLFSETIESNIAFAYDYIDKEKVVEASILADVHDNIKEFDKGYETVLGERGVTISGGQKQRTSIARALMKDASILILDDSVSAVDTKTEKVILENLKKTRVGKTTILIAHRISTVKDLDKILFLDEGKVLGFDTHENLYSTLEEYRNMVELQRLEEEKGGNA